MFGPRKAPARSAPSETAPYPGESYADLVDAEPLTPPVITVRPAEAWPILERAARSWATGQITVAPGQTRQLVSAHPARARIGISASGGVCSIGPSEGAAASVGYSVSGGVEMSHRGAVWAYVPAAAPAPVTVYYFAEYLDG